MRRHRGWIIAVFATLILAGLAFVAVQFYRSSKQEQVAEEPPGAPPDLEKLRATFIAGVDAVRRGDGAEATRQLESFSFGSRAVEDYRLFYLSQAHQLSGNPGKARKTLAALWNRSPKLVGWDEQTTRLAGLYASAGDWSRATAVAASVGTRSAVAATAGAARWQAAQAAFAGGDLAALLDQSRRIAVKSPRAAQAGDALEVVRALSGVLPTQAIHLTERERLERAVALMRDGDPLHAYEEMTALAASVDTADLGLPLQLNRGLALNQLRRFEESNRLLEPLVSKQFKIAIPALYTASKNYRVLSNSINPMVSKTIVVRQKVGTVKVKPKGKKKAVLRPKYANVKKIIQLVDLAKKAKKETYDRLSTERLKDMLSLPLAEEVRIEALNTLIAQAEAKNQDAYEQQLITQLAKIDPSQEAGLQHFWDKAWTAYTRGDLNGARALTVFIRDTYRNPNVKRQSQYWYARSIERLGLKEEAAAIYQDLASAPYADLYAVHAAARGAKRRESATNPLTEKRADWSDVAEHEMPAELRLAYELTALTAYREARIEIQKNMKLVNAHYADALMADIYRSNGDTLLMMRALRRAYPQIATVEQDSVPAYFLKMYYFKKYEDTIVSNAKANKLDPYIVMGLIHQESFFNPRARSSVGATGLMQLMPPTGKELAQRLHMSANLENPETNVKLGTYHFRLLVNMFGGAVNLAIASYNAGQGNVMKWRRAAPGKPLDEFLESIPFPETRNYVKRVNMLAASYRRFDQ